jgi:hypothetical protein
MPTGQKKGPAIARVTFIRHQAVIEQEFREGWSALAIYERHKAELSTISYRQFLRYVSVWRPLQAPTAAPARPKPRAQAPVLATLLAPSPAYVPPPPSDPGVRPPRLDSPPRERRRLVLRSPTPLAEGEPAPDDGSKLPIPLRPEPKQKG